MKISKTQIAIIISACVLLAIIILSLDRPQPKPAAPGAESKPEEEAVPQVGKYELPPAQENPGYPAQENAGYPALQTTNPHRTAEAGTVTENTQNTLNSLNPEQRKAQIYTPDPSLPKKPPKMPPPEKLQEMQRQGIVAF